METLRLSERDGEILALLDLNADMPLETVARKLRLKTHTVQYALNRMREHDVFKPSLCVNIHTLDRRYCGVFLSVKGGARVRARFISLLSTHPKVGWFAELAGTFDFGLAFAVRTPAEADTLLGDLIARSGVEVLAKAVSFRLHLVDTPRGYLSSKNIRGSPLEMRDGAPLFHLDERDYKILRALNDNPWSSHRALALRLGMPHTSFELRVKKLRGAGVVLGRTLQIPARATGREAHKLLIYAHGRPPALSDTLRRWAISHPNVSHYVEALGEWDYEVNLETRSLHELSSAIQELQNTFGTALNRIVPLSVVRVHAFSRFAITHGD